MAGSLVTWTYDAWNRSTEVKTTTDVGEAKVKTQYDANGNVISATPPIGGATLADFDELNRPTKVTQPVDGTDANNIVTTTDYDIAGRPHKVTNGRGKTTIRQYDERDLLASEKYPVENVRKWTYNAKGQPLTYTNRASGGDLVTRSYYDVEDNLRQVEYPDSRVAAYTTRLDGKRTSSWMTNIGGTTYTYNEAGELTQAVQPANLGGSLAALQYFYVPNNPRRESMWLKESNGGYRHSWYYQYDDGGRLQNTIQDSTSLVYTEYHPNGAPKIRYEGSALATECGYTKEGAVKTIVHSSSGLAKLTTSYTYDLNGNVRTNTTAEPGRPTISTTYGYDHANQLLSEWRTNGPAGLPSSAVYTYDKAGNRATVARNGGAASPAFLYSDNDRFQSGDGHSFSNYTDEGSPKSLGFPDGGSAQLTYNASEQMTQFYKTGGGATKLEWYLYDAEGRRYQKTAQVGGTNGITRYVYDGDSPVVEVDGSGAELRLTIPGAAFTEGGATTFLRENGVGSALATAAAGGAGLSRTEHDAFGNEAALQAGPRGPYRFVGRLGYYSDDTGLDLLGARYYVPALGRFLTRDPVGHQGGLNLYRYCGNNPLTKVDPDGKQGIMAAGILREQMFNQDRTRSTLTTQPPYFLWRTLPGVPDNNVTQLAQVHYNEWFFGWAPRYRSYDSASWESSLIENSFIGREIALVLREHGGLNRGETISGGVSTPRAAWDTLWSGVGGDKNMFAAMMGAVTYQVYGLGNGRAEVTVKNTTGLNSYMAHKGPNVYSRGMFSNVYYNFRYNRSDH